MKNDGLHRRTIIALVHDKPGVLARISGLFRRRGVNIESLLWVIQKKMVFLE